MQGGGHRIRVVRDIGGPGPCNIHFIAPSHPTRRWPSCYAHTTRAPAVNFIYLWKTLTQFVTLPDLTSNMRHVISTLTIQEGTSTIFPDASAFPAFLQKWQRGKAPKWQGRKEIDLPLACKYALTNKTDLILIMGCQAIRVQIQAQLCQALSIPR